MNNDLERFSEERLKELASTPEKYDHRYTCNMLNGDESRALARIALAAKQAKSAALDRTNAFTDEDLEGMAHGNNPVANAYRELLAFRRAAKQAKPVAFTGSGSLAAIAAGHEGYIWGSSSESHPIVLYTNYQIICHKCNGTGMADSGGTQPWGEPISVECDCTTPTANSPAIPDEMAVPDEMTVTAQMFAKGHNACRNAILQSGTLSGWVPFEGQSPYDAPYKIPSNLRELIAEEIGILFSDDDAQGIWGICRAAMIKSGNSPEIPDGWIECSERMPEVGVEVLIRISCNEHFNIESGSYKGDGLWRGAWCDTYGGKNSSYQVAHWMPLPAAPKPESE